MRGEQSYLGSSLLQNVLWFAPTSQRQKTTLQSKSRKPDHAHLTCAHEEETQEIRVCTNRTCRRQGSMHTLEILTDLSPPSVSVKSCGCLGRCGAGPNVAFLPQGTIVGHCGTASRAAQLIYAQQDAMNAVLVLQSTLDALALRKRAQKEIDLGSFSQAEDFLSQAIHLKPFGGLHVIYKCRSIARLAMGNHLGALDDAREASRLAPQYTEAYMCQGDAFMAMEQYGEAESLYSMCLKINPLLRRSKSFKARIAKLEEKLTALNVIQVP